MLFLVHLVRAERRFFPQRGAFHRVAVSSPQNFATRGVSKWTDAPPSLLFRGHWAVPFPRMAEGTSGHRRDSADAGRQCGRRPLLELVGTERTRGVVCHISTESLYEKVCLLKGSDIYNQLTDTLKNTVVAFYLWYASVGQGGDGKITEEKISEERKSLDA